MEATVSVTLFSSLLQEALACVQATSHNATRNLGEMMLIECHLKLDQPYEALCISRDAIARK